MSLCRQGMAVLLVGLAAWGCSKGSSQPAAATNPPAETISAAQNGSSEGSGAAAAQVEPPDAVVTRFLDALRRGEKEAVARLLTSAARAETVRLGYEINPPGDLNSKYEVGRVERVAGPPEEAFVSSVWTHNLGNGEVYSYEAVWIARREPDWQSRSRRTLRRWCSISKNSTKSSKKRAKLNSPAKRANPRAKR
jgi:hypothetical protein